METYNGIEEFKLIPNAVVTMGTFDGVHKGHEVLLNRLKNLASQYCGQSVVLTFFPHPRMVLYGDQEIKLLSTIDERQKIIEEAGIDHLIIHPFSQEFSRMSSLEYVRDILVNKLGVKCLVIGYDHHFGRNREGSFDQLQEYSTIYDFDLVEIPAKEIQQINISSTKIRASLLQGEIQAANQFLGYPYKLTGTVVKGNRIGREIGFPTANIKVKETYKLIPYKGVYAVKIRVRDVLFTGMLNIGSRPTVQGNHETIEVNIFDFSESIYNQVVEITFYERIRCEKKFKELSDLKAQLEIDKENTLQIFN